MTTERASKTSCPACGEKQHLRGERHHDTINLECESCGHTWQRDARKRCRACGSENLRYTPKPLWEKGRGKQRTPAGRIDAFACYDCGETDVVARVAT